MKTQARRLYQLVRQAIKAAKLLMTVRAALPRWLRVLLGVALVCTLLPGVPDLGLDEAIYVLAGVTLWFRHRTLLRVCWNGAGLEI